MAACTARHIAMSNRNEEKRTMKAQHTFARLSYRPVPGERKSGLE